MKWALTRFIAARWLAPALMALAVVAVGLSWTHGYQTGKKITLANQSIALEKLRLEAAELADELEAEKRRTKVVYRDRIRTVYSEPDISGCADVAIPARVLMEIRAATGQPANGTVREADAAGRNK